MKVTWFKIRLNKFSRNINSQKDNFLSFWSDSNKWLWPQCLDVKLWCSKDLKIKNCPKVGWTVFSKSINLQKQNKNNTGRNTFPKTLLAIIPFLFFQPYSTKTVSKPKIPKRVIDIISSTKKISVKITKQFPNTSLYSQNFICSSNKVPHYSYSLDRFTTLFTSKDRAASLEEYGSEVGKWVTNGINQRFLPTLDHKMQYLETYSEGLIFSPTTFLENSLNTNILSFHPQLRF